MSLRGVARKRLSTAVVITCLGRLRHASRTLSTTATGTSHVLGRVRRVITGGYATMSVTCAPTSLYHLGGTKGGTIVLNVRGKCTVNGSVAGMRHFHRHNIICVALYRGKGGSVYNSTHCGRRKLNMDAFNRRIVGRVGHIKVVMSISRTKRGDFCSTLTVDNGPVMTSRSSTHTLYSRPHGLASSRLGTLTTGKKITRMYVCNKFLHGGKRTAVGSTVRRLGRVMGIVNVRRMKVKASFSNSNNVANYTSTSRLVGFAHQLLLRECDRRGVHLV